MFNYDSYNREERAICSHLFRLLHEKGASDRISPLNSFVKIVLNNDLRFYNGKVVFSKLSFSNVGIFCEASIIRDYYHFLKPDVFGFLDNMVKIIMNQENVTSARLYSELPLPLNDIYKTHPNQIRQKADSTEISMTLDEKKVYGALQGMFNAKPDLILIVDNLLLVCEAKLTEEFDTLQLDRTKNIAHVWSELLYKELGFETVPTYAIFKLGAGKFNPDITWEQVSQIAKEVYPIEDRTRIAIEMGNQLLISKGLN